jgi:hypothetical protein
MPSGSWSDEPVPPSINIESPSETLSYWSGSDVWLNFTVAVPWTDWFSTKSGYLYPEPYATTLGTLTQVKFSVDGKPETNATKVSETPLVASRLYNPQSGLLHFSVNLGRLSVGQHTVIINAEGTTYYGNLTHSAFSDSFILDVQEGDENKLVKNSAQINFAVGPDSSPELEPETAEFSLTLPIVAVSIALVSAVAVGLLVYFKKRKH